MQKQTVRLNTLINTLENIISFKTIILSCKSRINNAFNSISFDSKYDVPKFILDSSVNSFESKIKNSSITLKLDDDFVECGNSNEILINKNDIEAHFKKM